MTLKNLFMIFGIAMVLTHFATAYTADDGTSDGNCICTRQYQPICASDGVTYSNQCSFDCKKKYNRELDIEYYGVCEEGESELDSDEWSALIL